MKSYTLGFIFDSSMQKVALIEKQRPDWQKGRLNGIGGKVEPGEAPLACIVREVREESGLETAASDWAPIAWLKGDVWTMEVYTLVHHPRMGEPRSITDEQVGWYDVQALPAAAISNVPWLVHMALDKLKNAKTFAHCAVNYGPN